MKITLKVYHYSVRGVRHSFATLPEALRSLQVEPVLSPEEMCVECTFVDIPVGNIVQT